MDTAPARRFVNKFCPLVRVSAPDTFRAHFYFFVCQFSHCLSAYLVNPTSPLTVCSRFPCSPSRPPPGPRPGFVDPDHGVPNDRQYPCGSRRSRRTLAARRVRTQGGRRMPTRGSALAAVWCLGSRCRASDSARSWRDAVAAGSESNRETGRHRAVKFSDSLAPPVTVLRASVASTGGFYTRAVCLQVNSDNQV